MSDLIEKVRDVLVKNESETFKDQASAVVLAVAKWLDEQPLETGNEPYDLAPARLFRELERLRGDK